VLTALVWQAALSAPDGRLHLSVLPASTDTVSGDALLIQTPGGRAMLINGGPSARQLSTALGRRLPPFDRRLDFLIVSGPRQGEVSALPEVIDRFPPVQVLWAGKPNASREASQLRQVLVDLGVRIEPAVAGQRLDLGDGAGLEVLAAGELGGVYLLSWKNFRALLPVGMGFEHLEALDYGRRIGPVSALLLGDHGYAPANPPEWIANLRPQLALLSVASDDRRVLPSPETLEAVEGYSLLRTDRNGWIEVSTDGERMWVEVERR
jgi:competence protein ComEC